LCIFPDFFQDVSASTTTADKRVRATAKVLENLVKLSEAKPPKNVSSYSYPNFVIVCYALTQHIFLYRVSLKYSRVVSVADPNRRGIASYILFPEVRPHAR